MTLTQMLFWTVHGRGTRHNTLPSHEDWDARRLKRLFLHRGIADDFFGCELPQVACIFASKSLALRDRPLLPVVSGATMATENIHHHEYWGDVGILWGSSGA